MEFKFLKKYLSWSFCHFQVWNYCLNFEHDKKWHKFWIPQDISLNRLRIGRKKQSREVRDLKKIQFRYPNSKIVPLSDNPRTPLLSSSNFEQTRLKMNFNPWPRAKANKTLILKEFYIKPWWDLTQFCYLKMLREFRKFHTCFVMIT